MPYYSDFGVSTTPISSSLYTSSYLTGPYANHSSILASNLSYNTFGKPSARNLRIYKPHLATISESQSGAPGLRRINSPKLRLHTTPQIIIPRPIKINTADIDVSVNKYRKYDRFQNKQQSPNVSDAVEPIKAVNRTESPQDEAKPTTNIRRDRATVRLHTIHNDKLGNNNQVVKSWRDNFGPNELFSQPRQKPVERKTPGQILKEKFLIKSRSKDNLHKQEQKKLRKASTKRLHVQKTPSFHDICEAITTNDIAEELNPGQPEEIQRRQSKNFASDELLRRQSEDLAETGPIKRRYSRKLSQEPVLKEEEENPSVRRRVSRNHSNENLLKEIRRSSAEISKEELLMLDDLLNDEQKKLETQPKKKRISKKRSNEKLVLPDKENVRKSPSSEDIGMAKSSLQRRLTQKRIHRTNTDSSITEEDTINKSDKIYQDAIRDISQVEIEKIKIKPKPIITATINVEEKQTPSPLKAVIDDVEIVESPKPTKEKKFKFNVVVEVDDKKKIETSPQVKKDCKVFEKQTHTGLVQVPKAKDPVVANLLRKKHQIHVGHVLEDIKEVVREDNVKGETENESLLQAKKEANANTFQKSDGNAKLDINKTKKEAILLKTSDIKNDVLEKNKVADEKSKNDVKPIVAKSSLETKLTEKEKSSPIAKIPSLDKNEKVKLLETPKSPLEKDKTILKEPPTNKDEKTKSVVIDNKTVVENKNDSKILSSKESEVKTPVVVEDKKAVEVKKDIKPLTLISKTPLVKDSEIKTVEKSSPISPINKDEKPVEIKKDSEIKTTEIKTTKKSSPISKIPPINKDEKPVETIKNNKLETTNLISNKNDSKVEKKDVEIKNDHNETELMKTNSATNVSKVQNTDTIINKNDVGVKKLAENIKLDSKTGTDSTVQLKTASDVKNTSQLKDKVKNNDVLKTRKTNEASSENENKIKPIDLKENEIKAVVNKVSNESSTKNNEEKPKLNALKKERKEETKTKKLVKEKSEENDTNNNLVEKSESEEQIKVKKLISKRSLVQKAHKDDPDMEVFNPPEAPEPVPEPEPEPKEEKFIPLQSNRLSHWMHPFKKPEQLDKCPVEIFARPKWIRGRHYPRPRHPQVQQPVQSEEDESDDEDDEEETSTEEETSESEEETSDETTTEDESDNMVNNKIGANSLENRDSPLANHRDNPAFSVEEIPEEYSQSSTYASFQKSGRITPPATTIPRFRKYCIDDFNFLKLLGKGSFGKVLLAELKDTEYYYAVKCLKKDVVLEDDDVECTLIERKVLALGTKHPYLCHLLCTFQTESHLFFVMEYLNGGDLMFHIQQSGRFDEPRARFYAAEIVSGLKFLHNKGIVYRDLKLDNILLDFDGHVRIADFGMCKLQIFLDRMADTFCGTPDYMAPEIIKGLHYNQCVDWWSFGILLYEMLTGQSPFSGCDEDELFWSICNEKPVFPRYLSTEAHNVLQLFLEKDASKRLGNRFCAAGDIQDQPFFRHIDWRDLEARRLEPPFKPNLQHPLDTQYFDKTFTVEKAKLTPIDQTILQSMDQTQFQGFSYTNPNATDK